ncbi:hypothetical protein BJI67_00340 [Acidihalobacter aeolianus]|uniref:DNA repair ATPase n=1 Tax=Acidihalobacter aeolianus TaxID=2792603 RepID=A0A1D8KBL5_9GAMM|nr:hypothetical protein [Acidihalobacter aeolianus]AOV18326.1 hypothetical protein BJI67_00340 [Acidihalobacter aeolianus]
MANKSTSKSTFKFKNHQRIGAVQAEFDTEFLQDCFIDTGDLEIATDVKNPRSILVGRTGSGKSALLLKVKECEENVIEISPENLSLDYISNSNIISFFEEAGLNLDILFRFLWKHVLIVELLKHKYDLKNESATSAFLSNITGLLKRDRQKQKGIQYLKQWGEKFWEDTEFRVKEVVSNIENKLKADVKSISPTFTLSAEAAKTLTDSQRQEIVERGKKAVSEIQIRDLAEAIKFLAEDVFTNGQQRHYLIIDRLDENWASKKIRYKLIRALIEEIKSFRKIGCLKILITMWLDLLEDVFEKTKDAGFQEEKYRDLLLPIQWNEENLLDLVKSRINHLLKYNYTNHSVQFDSIFPGSIRKRKTFDYLIERTFMRPRDIISYLNFVLERAAGKSSITVDLIQSAEEDYSEERIRSVEHEWASIHPSLAICKSILEKRRDGFRIQEISEDQLNEISMSLAFDDKYIIDSLSASASAYLNHGITSNSFRYDLINALYHVGMVGIKQGPRHGTKWSFNSHSIIGKLNLKSDMRVYIHPMFWRNLDISAQDEDS